MIFNESNVFTDKTHETVMGVWYSGVILKRMARAFFSSEKINEAQFNCLMALKYAEHPLSQQEASKKLLVDKSNITSIIDVLEQLNFAKRVRLPSDRRTYRLEITSAGSEYLDKLEKKYRAKIARVLDSFTADELAATTRLMVKFQRALEQEEKSQR